MFILLRITFTHLNLLPDYEIASAFFVYLQAIARIDALLVKKKPPSSAKYYTWYVKIIL